MSHLPTFGQWVKFASWKTLTYSAVFVPTNLHPNPKQIDNNVARPRILKPGDTVKLIEGEGNLESISSDGFCTVSNNGRFMLKRSGF